MNVVADFSLNDFMPGSKTELKLKTLENALGDSWQVPIIVLKGKLPGPVLGVTAAIHGNELNGIPIIHNLIAKINPEELSGTLLAVPIMNIPGFLNGTREFSDGKDLNRLMPGKIVGTSSEVYTHHLFEKIGKKLNYLIDIHTASFGRINSLYVRADLTDPEVAKMARLQEPQIILNNKGDEGTFRGYSMSKGIKSICVEVGDSHIFQKNHIRPSIFGIYNVLVELGMVKDEKAKIDHRPVICKKSLWLYASNGGILSVKPELTQMVKKGDIVATIRDIFGKNIDRIEAPRDGIVIGKSTNPVCHVGTRMLHLGVEWEDFPKL